MIPLRLEIEPLPLDEPVVTRLRSDGENPGPYDASFVGRDGDYIEYDLAGVSLRLKAPPLDAVDDDVLLLLPRQRSAHRLIRANSPHNTFLVTERCDQLCVMCSQPPKPHHVDLFPYFAQAATLAPRNVYIGISGGEPTLYKQALFDLLLTTLDARPDLRFHVLTNGQHFEETDLEVLQRLPHDRVLWGIPLYATDPATHDGIVVKAGAFDRLMRSFAILGRAGAAVELRTVVMRTNVGDLTRLASFVTTHLPFVACWAIMQLENIGYGRKNWDALFLDTSIHFDIVGAALDISHARGVDTKLYNFPLCTVPAAHRRFAPQTISDWKRRYLEACAGCKARDACAGFFEWYRHERGFGRVTPL